MYALVRRLLSFKNPFTEIKAYLKTKKVAKFNLYKEPVINENYQSFNLL
jgi:hypothetical protein